MSTNFNITTKPVTTTHVVVELDEAQARALLVDATEFQGQLRAALERQERDRRTIGRRARPNGRGHRLNGRGARPKQRKQKRVLCENCGVLIAAYKQGKHKCKSPALDAKS